MRGLRDAAVSAARDLGAPAAPSAATVISLGVIGSAIGPLVVFADAPSWSGTSCFTSTAQFAFWVFAIAAQTALWAIVSVPVVRSLRALRRYWPGNQRQIIVSAALFSSLLVAFIASAVLVPRLDYPLPHHHLKVLILTGLGFPVALGAAVGMWLVHAALKATAESGEVPADRVTAYLGARDHLRRLLAIEGGIIGSAILASGALRQAVIHTACVHRGDFPQEFVLLYGAFFSALLGLVYAPVHARLLTVGRQLRDELYPLPDPTSPVFTTWAGQRHAFEDLLQLDVPTGQSLQASVAILAPLGSAILGLLLGGAK